MQQQEVQNTVQEQELDYKSLYLQAQLTIEVLQFELSNLKKLIYGSKHERFIPIDEAKPTQMSLGLQAEISNPSTAVNTKQIAYTRVTKSAPTPVSHPGRHKLPDHLERRETVIEPDEDVTGLKKIGEEVTEELDCEPGKLIVNRYVRPKYAKAGNEGVVIAPMIERPLPKAIAGAGLLAQIAIDKYVDHIPLHRQNARFKREGVPLPSSTLGDWLSSTCMLLDSLFACHQKLVLQSTYLHVDETPLKVLDRDKKGSTHRGYYWVYHNSIEGLVLFDYQPTRGREGPQQLLKDFQGYLQTDGYSVYDFYKKQEGITVLHCMAHARRMFYESQQHDLPRATYALEQMGLLYAIERKATEMKLSTEEVLQLRQEEAKPILNELGAWMKEQYAQVTPKSPMGKALAYAIQRWDELMVYTIDGKLNIDNNPVENSIRPVALGRKNYLFAGSHEAAQRSAMFYSLLGTCKMHVINPFIYLKDVLSRIPTHPVNRVQELLPQNWKVKA